MALWSAVLEVFQATLFSLTQFYGGHLGGAIVALSLGVRVALLPITVPMAVRSRRRARTLRALAPGLTSLREEWKDDPTGLARETIELYRRHDLSPLDLGSVRGLLIQTPVLLALYRSVTAAVQWDGVRRAFLWVSDLARPDIGLAAVAALISGAAVGLGASEGQPAWLPAVSVAAIGIMAMTTSAGFALYLTASSTVGGFQALLVRRIEEKKTAGGRVPS